MKHLVLACFVGLLCLPVAAQTPAESNPEAVHISRTYGIPQLNGRLLLPGEGYDALSIGPQLAPINQAWRQYAASYRMPTEGFRTLVEFFRRRPEMFKQLMSQSTRATPNAIEEMMGEKLNRLSYRLSYEPGRYGLDEFDTRSLNASMEATVAAMRHKPAVDRIPVTILNPARFGAYDFGTKAFRTFADLRSQWFLRENWFYEEPDGKRHFEQSTFFLAYPEENAQALARSLDANPFGQNIFFVGVEADVSPGGGSVEILRVIYALDPALTERFHERDFAAEQAQRFAARQAEKRAEEQAQQERRQQANEAARQQAAVEQQAEAAGFERDRLAPIFETAGLVLGAPPPADLAATRYDKTGRTFPIPALQAFFHANVTGGQVGFMTSDATPTGNVVYISRVFENENVTREALLNAVQAKLGAPSAKSGSRTLFWMSSKIPAERKSACRLKVANTAIGNAALMGGSWTRPPMPVNPNMFKANCGLVANLNLHEMKYGAADTTYFNRELEKALAAQRAAKAEVEAEAEAEIDF